MFLTKGFAMRIIKRLLLSLVVAFTLTHPATPVTYTAQVDRAKPATTLVLQITVDQLRGDMLLRHRDQFGRDGFRRLMEQGTYFTNASYGTANTSVNPICVWRCAAETPA